MQAFATRWIFAAALAFVLAVLLGVWMGATHDFTLRGVHVHLNLLGWVSMALIGVIYHLLPSAGATRLATVQFWLHVAALAVMTPALGLVLLGNTGMEPLLGASSLAMLVAVVMFAGNLWLHAGAGAGTTARATAAGG